MANEIQIIGLLVGITGLLIAVESKYGTITKLLSKLTSVSLEDVVMDKWSEETEIERDGTCLSKITMNGHVNFGVLHEKEIEIITPRKQTWKSLNFVARNEKGAKVKHHLTLDADKIKQVSLPVGNLTRRDHFKICCTYVLKNNLVFNQPAWCTHRAIHNEKMIRMVLRFAEGIIIKPSSVNGYEITAGGIQKPLTGSRKPKLTCDDPCTIQLLILKVKRGSNYEITWFATKTNK